MARPKSPGHVLPGTGVRVYEPWERQQNEDGRAFAAFCYYRDKPKRKLSHVIREYFGEEFQRYAHLAENPVARKVARWARKYHWDLRVQAWDDFQDQQKRQATIDELVAFRKRTVQAGLVVSSKAMAALLKKSEEDWNSLPTTVLLELMERGIALEGKALALPTATGETPAGPGLPPTAAGSNGSPATPQGALTPEDMGQTMRNIVASVDGQPSSVQIQDFLMVPQHVIDSQGAGKGKQKKS